MLYEVITMVLFEGKKAISIHIPSDAKLTRESCEASFKAAKDFFLHFAKEYADGIYFCDSWLLAPNLMFVLPAKSGILLFQRFFHIIKIDTENDDYMEWVFKNSNLSLDEVPQNTSLQSRITSYNVCYTKLLRTIKWMEQDKTENFRSVLELMHLVNSIKVIEEHDKTPMKDFDVHSERQVVS